MEGSSPPVNARSTAWIGIVGSQDSLDRLEGSEEPWWCLPTAAATGDMVVMYCTASVSRGKQGVFAVYRVTASDPERQTECRRFGSGSGYSAMQFTKLELVRRLEAPITAGTLRADPILGQAKCVKRSFQGTFFQLEPQEARRISKLAKVAAPSAKDAT